MRDPYDILGVPKKANDADIKKAFRTLAKKYHPDSHGNDPKAVKKFQELNTAYEILGDKEKRAQYDRGEIDEAGQPKGFNPGAQGFSGQGFNAADFEQMFRRGGGAGGGRGGPFRWSSDERMNAEDLFADLLGGLGGGRKRAQPKRGGDIVSSATISFEEAINGGTRRIALSDGKQLEVRIPPGVKDGQQIRLRGQGQRGERGGPAGDLLITISVGSHPLYTREGRHLRMDLPVTLKEAVVGAKMTVPTLSGPVTLTVPPHSNTGTVLRLKGKGLPAAGNKAAGDLYARLVVTLPEGTDPKLDEFAKDWPADYDPRAKLR